MSKERLGIHNHFEIGKAFAKGFLGSVLNLERKVPELTSEEAKKLDDLILTHEKISEEQKDAPFTERERELILKLWNYQSPISGIKDERKGGRYPLHIHHLRARAFGGKSEITNAIPLTREEHCKVHFGMEEAYIRYRRGEKDAFEKYEQMRERLREEPQLDREWRLYLQGRVDERIRSMRNYQKKTGRKLFDI